MPATPSKWRSVVNRIPFFSSPDISDHAEDLLRHIGKADETVIAAVQCMSTKRTDFLDVIVGGTIPGFSLLLRKHSRVIVVTDRQIYLLRGNSELAGRGCELLSTYERHDDLQAP